MFRRTHPLYFIGTVAALVLGGTAVQAEVNPKGWTGGTSQ
jgi:hypothetical protein